VLPDAGFIVPQAAAGLPPTVKVTVSALTEVPLNVVTFATKVCVAEPVAETVAVAGVTATTFGAAVWVIAIVVLAPDPASVAVRVQVPTVVLTV
jgi:hypothetical protein